jgi:hypothetical protein
LRARVAKSTVQSGKRVVSVSIVFTYPFQKPPPPTLSATTKAGLAEDEVRAVEVIRNGAFAALSLEKPSDMGTTGLKP